MDNIKSVIAKNIIELRRTNGMTQLELAERLNYSDKAISKWERAESLPDVSVLVDISKLFGVPLDYLVKEEHTADEIAAYNNTIENVTLPYSKRSITAVSIILVWFIAMLVFVLLTIFTEHAHYRWLPFIYAIPASSIVGIVFNSIWFKPRMNYGIVSVLMWSVLLSVHISLLPFGINIFSIYLLGIPGQIIIFLWSLIKKPQKHKP